MIALAWILAFLFLISLLAYKRASLIVWTIMLVFYLLLVTKFTELSLFSLSLIWLIFLLLAIPLNIFPIRAWLISRHALRIFRKYKPHMSSTEKEALEVGTVGWDGELFSGMPEWNQLLSYPVPKLNEEEQAFLDGPVDALCQMVDNWKINHELYNLPPDTWQFLRDNGFFGIIIPKKYGGIEFSAFAHSAILTKIAGRSITAATIVGVPNSLGPAELLLEYGTEKQKNYYLPRLARGEEIPCFGLTSAEAGSDASAMPDYGVVCKGMFEGEEIIGIRLNWSKRYITLAPVATLLGLAFKLYDPEHLIAKKTECGITCALIPTNFPGVITGRRHYPAFSAFPNGPTQGKDVFIPVDWIIGGPEMAGRGWHMLVERLSVGRAISLPSTGAGASKLTAFATGAYARIRKQFHIPIGRFGGVEEALARIAGKTYLIEATRVFTVSAIDRGERPAVPSAISKYWTTELGRNVMNDAMDIHGGKGICLGPRNYLGQPYAEMPIAITVEGANILTRAMIIFGQGAIRCHPYILAELTAAQETDDKQAVKKFDKALFGHIGFLISNKVRAFWLGLTQAHLTGAPTVGVTRRFYQQLTRFSSAFALLADVSMLTLGAELKRREKLSGRLGDILSLLYIGSAVLKRYQDEGQPKEDLPLVQWACYFVLFEIENTFHTILRNFPNRWIALMLRMIIFPTGRRFAPPSDKLGHKVASLFLDDTQTRQRLAQGAYLTPDSNNPVGQINIALKQIVAAEELEKRFHHAEHEKQLSGYTFEEKIESAAQANLFTLEEINILLATHAARAAVIAVDDFSPEEL